MLTRIWAALREHVGLALSVASALLVMVRVSAVSGYIPQTVLIVAQKQGTSAIIFGTLLPMLQVLPALASIVIFWRIHSTPEDADDWSSGALALALLGFSVLLSPWPFAAFLAVLMFVMVSLAVRVARTGRVEGRRRMTSPFFWLPTRIFLIALGVVVFVVASFSNKPWLPREQITGARTAEGFVLDADDDYIYLLQDSPRTVLKIPLEGIHRDYCSQHEAGTGFLSNLDRRPVLGLFTETDTYPSCREIREKAKTGDLSDTQPG